MTDKSDPRALSVKEACERMGIGRNKFYEEVNSGRLTARKHGNRTLILQSDLEAWLENLPRFETSRDS